MTSLCEIWNTPYSKIIDFLTRSKISIKTETGAYIRASQRYSRLNQLPQSEQEIVEDPNFQSVMLKTAPLPLNQRLIVGIRELERLRNQTPEEIESLNNTITLLQTQVELQAKALNNRKFQVENCPLNVFDDDLGNIIDPVTLEVIDPENFTLINNKYCYNNSTLEHIVRTQTQPTDPMTREPIPQEIVQRFRFPSSELFGRMMNEEGDLDLSGLNLTDQNLAEIEWPQELRRLDLTENQLTTFDTSSLPQGLLSLNLNYNLLTTFDVSQLPRILLSLDLRGNKLTDFDASRLPRGLLGIDLRDNQLNQSINFSYLPQRLLRMNL